MYKERLNFFLLVPSKSEERYPNIGKLVRQRFCPACKPCSNDALFFLKKKTFKNVGSSGVGWIIESVGMLLPSPCKLLRVVE